MYSTVNQCRHSEAHETVEVAASQAWDFGPGFKTRADAPKNEGPRMVLGSQLRVMGNSFAAGM